MKYDSVFILNDRKFEDGGTAYAEKIKSIIEELGGGDVEVKNYGRQRFARPIQKRTSGIYLRFFYNLAEDNVKDFQDKFRLEEGVIRHVAFKYEIPESPRTLKLEQ